MPYCVRQMQAMCLLRRYRQERRRGRENNALQEEANKRYETTESQLRIMKNHIQDAGITLGSVFLPVLTKAAGKISELADKLAGMDKGTQQAIVGILCFLWRYYHRY